MIYANDYVFWGVPRYILMVDRVYKTATIVNNIAAVLAVFYLCYLLCNFNNPYVLRY